MISCLNFYNIRLIVHPASPLFLLYILNTAPRVILLKVKLYHVTFQLRTLQGLLISCKVKISGPESTFSGLAMHYFCPHARSAPVLLASKTPGVPGSHSTCWKALPQTIPSASRLTQILTFHGGLTLNTLFKTEICSPFDFPHPGSY